MYKKKLTFLMVLIFLLNSCSTWEDTKGALTGAKRTSSDEFLVEKKDPLVLPPDYEKLPNPDSTQSQTQESSIFENTIGSEEASSANDSIEESILKKIKKK